MSQSGFGGETPQQCLAPPDEVLSHLNEQIMECARWSFCTEKTSQSNQMESESFTDELAPESLLLELDVSVEETHSGVKGRERNEAVDQDEDGESDALRARDPFSPSKKRRKSLPAAFSFRPDDDGGCATVPVGLVAGGQGNITPSGSPPESPPELQIAPLDRRFGSIELKPVILLTFNDVRKLSRDKLATYCAVNGIETGKLSKADLEIKLIRYISSLHPEDVSYALTLKNVHWRPPSLLAQHGIVPSTDIPATKDKDYASPRGHVRQSSVSASSTGSNPNTPDSSLQSGQTSHSSAPSGAQSGGSPSFTTAEMGKVAEAGAPQLAKHAGWRMCARCKQKVSSNGFNFVHHMRKCDPAFFAAELKAFEESRGAMQYGKRTRQPREKKPAEAATRRPRSRKVATDAVAMLLAPAPAPDAASLRPSSAPSGVPNAYANACAGISIAGATAGPHVPNSGWGAVGEPFKAESVRDMPAPAPMPTYAFYPSYAPQLQQQAKLAQQPYPHPFEAQPSRLLNVPLLAPKAPQQQAAVPAVRGKCGGRRASEHNIEMARSTSETAEIEGRPDWKGKGRSMSVPSLHDLTHPMLASNYAFAHYDNHERPSSLPTTLARACFFPAGAADTAARESMEVEGGMLEDIYGSCTLDESACGGNRDGSLYGADSSSVRTDSTSHSFAPQSRGSWNLSMDELLFADECLKVADADPDASYLRFDNACKGAPEDAWSQMLDGNDREQQCGGGLEMFGWGDSQGRQSAALMCVPSHRASQEREMEAARAQAPMDEVVKSPTEKWRRLAAMGASRMTGLVRPTPVLASWLVRVPSRANDPRVVSSVDKKERYMAAAVGAARSAFRRGTGLVESGSESGSDSDGHDSAVVVVTGHVDFNSDAVQSLLGPPARPEMHSPAAATTHPDLSTCSSASTFPCPMCGVTVGPIPAVLSQPLSVSCRNQCCTFNFGPAVPAPSAVL